MFGGVVRDVRGAGRALRVSWHREDGLVVLSLWDGSRCTGTVRVATTDVPTLIESLSSTMTLRPGAVILTGTPQGVGFARKPPVWMKHGDTVVVELEKIGKLENPVRNE